MSEVKDFCNPPRVVRTGMGWGVRIDGTDVFEGINQHGYKTLRTLDIVIGLSSEQEAKEYLAQWLSDQLPDFDAQRLRADTAEAKAADYLLAWGKCAELRDAAEQRIAELSGLLMEMVEHDHRFIDAKLVDFVDRIEELLSTASPATINQQGEEA